MPSKSALAIFAIVALSIPAAAKRRTVWAGEWEYIFDDRKISKRELERLLAFRQHGQIVTDVVGGEVSMLWMNRSTTDFSKWADWGPAWREKVRTWLTQRSAELATLEATKVPAELEPVKAYFVEQVRFFVEREGLASQLLIDDKPQRPTATVGGIDVVKTCPKQIDNVVTTPDRGARIDRISGLGNCLNAARLDAYPTDAWQAFLKKHRIRERQHTELNGP